MADLKTLLLNQDTQGAEVFESAKERLNFYRSEIHFESTLLASRTSSYLSSQSFLMIAFASSMANTNPEWGSLFRLVVPSLLAVLGLVTSMHAVPGIRASYDVIERWHRKQAELLQTEGSAGLLGNRQSALFGEGDNPAGGERYKRTLLFSLRTPVIFGSVWALLGAFCVVLYVVGVD
ncbi:hypothetical protein [Stutzerimonas chloritidismutans]|uniref:hypothetical protein n=1 Tax=Stutzerimonas chloritidismutans TaxID=203192 RepID=UPI003F18F277